MSRLIDADRLLKFKTDHEMISTHLVWNAPTVEAEPVRHGHWIFNPKDAFEMMLTLPKCSECGAGSPDSGNYCPNCGRKMDEEAGDDE